MDVSDRLVFGLVWFSRNVRSLRSSRIITASYFLLFPMADTCYMYYTTPFIRVFVLCYLFSPWKFSPISKTRQQFVDNYQLINHLLRINDNQPDKTRICVKSYGLFLFLYPEVKFLYDSEGRKLWGDVLIFLR